MQFSSLAILAASIVSTMANDPNWVTYTKPLASHTIVVTKYVGSEPLTGSGYTTRSSVVTDGIGNTLYTLIATDRADGYNADATTSVESSEESVVETSAAETNGSTSTSVESSITETAAASSTEGTSVAESSSESSSAAISTFEGAANFAGVSVAALAVGAVALII